MPTPRPPAPARFTTIAQWGANRRLGSVPDTSQITMARHAFDALASIVDDHSSDLASPAPFMTVDVEETGQTWVYSVDSFLSNLARRAGDQSRVRACLARLAPPAPNDQPDARP